VAVSGIIASDGRAAEAWEAARLLR